MHKIALFLLLIPLACKAFEPLNTDDAGTVAKGLNQIEQYFFMTASHGGGSANTVDVITPGEEYFGRQSAKALPFTYTRGITDNIELSLGATYFATPSGSFSPVSNKVIAIKWRFAENDQWGLAVKPSITLPGSPQQQVAGLGLALPNYGVNVIASRYWDLVEIHLNATYSKSLYNTNYKIGTGATENRTNIWFFSMAPVWKVADKVKLALDIGLTTNPPSAEQYLSNYALIAAIISASNSVDIGISYMKSAANMGIIVSNSGINASRSEIGFTWRF